MLLRLESEKEVWVWVWGSRAFCRNENFFLTNSNLKFFWFQRWNDKKPFFGRTGQNQKSSFAAVLKKNEETPRTHTRTHTLSLPCTLLLTSSHTHKLSLTRTLSLSSLSHTHSLSRSHIVFLSHLVSNTHSLSHTIKHTLTLFPFSALATHTLIQKPLNMNTHTHCLSLSLSRSTPWSCEQVHKWL